MNGAHVPSIKFSRIALPERMVQLQLPVTRKSESIVVVVTKASPLSWTISRAWALIAFVFSSCVCQSAIVPSYLIFLVYMNRSGFHQSPLKSKTTQLEVLRTMRTGRPISTVSMKILGQLRISRPLSMNSILEIWCVNGYLTHPISSNDTANSTWALLVPDGWCSYQPFRLGRRLGFHRL